MAKYVFAYRGGMVPETEEQVQKVMAAWTAWYGELGSSVVDGGNPFGPSLNVERGSTSEGGSSALTGYTIVSADSLELAGKLAAGCPILDGGGAVEVYEAVDM